MRHNTITGLTALPLLVATSMYGADERSNVLYIMTDQQSYYMISAITESLDSDPYANNPYFSTPNLDRLVKSGYTFSNCYAAHPVSGPSRLALLTGESPNSFGMTGNFSPGGENGERLVSVISSRAMGNLFKNAGYQTYYGGKVHLPWANGRSDKGSIYEKPTKYGFDHYITDDDRNDLAIKGAEFFSEYKEKDPFLLFLSFMNPHDICMTQVLFNNKNLEDFKADEIDMRARRNQLRYRQVYRDMDPAQFEGEQLAKLPANINPTDKFPLNAKNRQFELTPYNCKVHMWFYYRLMEQVDKEIGVVLDALEKSQYKDNTLIVFTSDHGEMATSHGMVGKNVPYQECQKVPMIFAGKGIKQGVIDNTTPVCNGWDLLPTMLDMASIDIPHEIKGLSLYKTITTGAKVNRKHIYYETVNSFGVLEDGRYKYTRFGSTKLPQNEAEALFDLKTDPGELHNLVFDESYAKRLKVLREVLEVEMKHFGTSWALFDQKKGNKN